MTERLTAEQMVLRAYCAGVIDGEGYLGAIRRLPTKANKMSSPKYSVRFSVMMADRDPVVAIASLIGVEDMVYVRRRKAKEHHAKMYVLDLESHRAIALVRLVLPYLKGKKEQAELLCKFYDFRAQSRKHRTKRGAVFQFAAGRYKGRDYTVRQLSESYLDECDRYYVALRRRFISNNGHVARSFQ